MGGGGSKGGYEGRKGRRYREIGEAQSVSQAIKKNAAKVRGVGVACAAGRSKEGGGGGGRVLGRGGGDWGTEKGLAVQTDIRIGKAARGSGNRIKEAEESLKRGFRPKRGGGSGYRGLGCQGDCSDDMGGGVGRCRGSSMGVMPKRC